MAVAGAVLLCGGSGLLGREAYLEAKGMLAERLIVHALERHLEDGEAHRPWSWADFHPIAWLEVPHLRVRRHVLSGASGTSLAFGPGHVDGTAPPNGPGTCVLAGHRDTWLRFARDLRPGDEVTLRTTEGSRRYVARSGRVVPEDDLSVLELASPGSPRRLVLVTCWPFEGLLRSPWRYVVECEEQETALFQTGTLDRPDAVHTRRSHHGTLLRRRSAGQAFF